MLIQTALVALTAAIAAGYLARQSYRTWLGGCATGCGAGKCGSSGGGDAKLIAPEDLLCRARRRRVER